MAISKVGDGVKAGSRDVANLATMVGQSLDDLGVRGHKRYWDENFMGWQIKSHTFFAGFLWSTPTKLWFEVDKSRRKSRVPRVLDRGVGIVDDDELVRLTTTLPKAFFDLEKGRQVEAVAACVRRLAKTYLSEMTGRRGNT